MNGDLGRGSFVVDGRLDGGVVTGRGGGRRGGYVGDDG